MTGESWRPIAVVMGASGSGKTTIGQKLAAELETPFLDADALHPSTNVDKMAAGTPLTTEDRRPWLTAVGKELAAAAARGTGLIVACSSLARSYRDIIREQHSRTIFVHLDGTRELLARRLSQRENHFMPPSLLDSQLQALQPLGEDESGVTVDVAGSPEEIVETAAAAIRGMR